jgi:ADP-ribose pyrophosphatase YjhB (NUDIX family)
MQIKIYAGEKPIYFSDELNSALRELSEKSSTLIYKKEAGAAEIIKALEKDAYEAAIITGEKTAAIKNIFFAQFDLIEAAGGIVQNEEKDILFIFRREKWDLPKGKKEAGEDAETCAAREIEEETGVTNLQLKRKVGETYHIYREREKDILKLTHWFYFTCASVQKITPQTIEDITEVKWIPTQKIKEPMGNTYKNIRDIMTVFFDTP